MLRKAIVLLLLLVTAFAAAQGGIQATLPSGSVGRDPRLSGVSFVPKPGAVPPMDVPLVDDRGNPTNPGRLLRGRPLVILPIFYRCNGVCTTEMQGVLNALAKNPKLVPGRDLDVVVLGLNPKETPELAAAKKAEYLEQYGRPETKDGWTFLTGTMANVTRVASALGVHYTYDPVKDTVNHPSAVLILTPEGRVSTAMTGGMYPTARFAEDIEVATKSQVSDFSNETSFLGCIHTDPVTGQRSIVVQGVMRLFAVTVVLALIATMTVLSLRRRPASSDR